MFVNNSLLSKLYYILYSKYYYIMYMYFCFPIDEWFGTIGQWNVEVTSVDLAQDEGNDKDPLILVVVHRPEMVVEQIESVNPDHSC